MSKTIVGGIFINVVMVVIIILIIIYGILFPATELEQCETRQSRFCYTIQCPCDDSQIAPCFGYAKMPSEDGNWYCSSAPYTKVDSMGNIL